MKSFLLCIIGIVTISPLYSGSVRAQVTVVSGYTVTQLATGIDRPWVAGGTSTNGYTGDLYVTTGSTQRIVRIDTSGTVTAFADLSAIVPFDATFWATFDLVGNYGGELFVDDDNIATPDTVYRVDSAGTGFAFASGPGTDNDVLTFDPFGAFQGSLFLHEGASLATLYRVSTSGVVSAFATGVPDFTGQIAFSPGGGFGTSMYIAGEANGLIYTIPSTHTAGQAATLFAGFQTNSGSVNAGGIAISDSGSFGTDVMYVNDTNSAAIVTVDVTGATTSTFVSGLTGTTVVNLIQVGDFAGKMVLTDLGDGSIYVIAPDPPPVPSFGGMGTIILTTLFLVAGVVAVRRSDEPRPSLGRIKGPRKGLGTDPAASRTL